MTTKETDAFVDLTAFVPSENSILEILSADGMPTGWKIELNSPSDPRARAHSDSVAKRDLHRRKQVEQAQANNKKYVADELSPDEARRENVRGVVARIANWTPIRIGGETYAFSDDVAINLLIKPEMAPFLVQIADALNDEKRFTKRSAKA